jgi:hypothetical protein
VFETYEEYAAYERQKAIIEARTNEARVEQRGVPARAASRHASSLGSEVPVEDDDFLAQEIEEGLDDPYANEEDVDPETEGMPLFI